jgi:hypothetical protein
VPSPLYWRVAARAGFRCEYCLAPQVTFNDEFQVEHIVPRARGGLTILGNLALSCVSCSLSKQARIAFPDPHAGLTTWLFNPRSQDWDTHFAIDLTTGTIGGKTPVGRATVVCLNLNSESQLVARQLWLPLGIIP